MSAFKGIGKPVIVSVLVGALIPSVYYIYIILTSRGSTAGIGFLELIKAKCGLSEMYGINWDAFLDNITGVPEEVIFKGWTKLKNHLPKEAQDLKECFEDAKKQGRIGKGWDVKYVD